MQRRIVGVIFMAVFWLMGVGLQAQNSKVLPSEKTEFIEEFVKRISKTTSDKEIQKSLEAFQEEWTTGKYSPEEQERFITQTNIMLLKNYNIGTEVLSYAKVFRLLHADDAYGRLNVMDFFTVTDSCVLVLDRKATTKYLSFLQIFLEEGAAFRTSNASWKFTQSAPKLGLPRSWIRKEVNLSAFPSSNSSRQTSSTAHNATPPTSTIPKARSTFEPGLDRFRRENRLGENEPRCGKRVY